MRQSFIINIRPVVDVIKLCFGGNLEILDFPKIGVISDKVEKFRKV